VNLLPEMERTRTDARQGEMFGENHHMPTQHFLRHYLVEAYCWLLTAVSCGVALPHLPTNHMDMGDILLVAAADCVAADRRSGAVEL